MGRVSDDMTRLCDEIAAMASVRDTLMQDLSRTTNTRRAEVADLLSSFSDARSASARKTKADLAKFQADVQRSVRRLRHEVKNTVGEFRTDMVGAKQAWSELTAPVTEMPMMEAGEADVPGARERRGKPKKRRR